MEVGSKLLSQLTFFFMRIVSESMLLELFFLPDEKIQLKFEISNKSTHKS